MSRLCAFKKSGIYYVFNDTLTALKPISFNPNDPVYLDWMDATILNSLTQEQCSMVSGYYLELYSTIEDDVYNVSMENYDILQTTDTSQFKLTGYAGILSMVIAGSNTCHVILSFDGRKTWVYYNTSTQEWEKTAISQIFSAKSNTVSQVNGFTQAIFAKKFVKHCSLDYAIAITNSENISSVSLTLPENQAPVIISLQVTANAKTHKAKIKIAAHVDDYEGNNYSYKITRTWRGVVDGSANVDKGLVEEGDCPLAANGFFEYIIDPANFEIGYNRLTFTYTDEAGESSSAYVDIQKVNETAYMSIAVNKDKLSYTINDEDSDGGRYKILLNGEIITPDQDEDPDVIAAVGSGWSKYCANDGNGIIIQNLIQLPWDKIIFGVPNTIEIIFQEDIYDAVAISSQVQFIGKYYGILFVDPSTTDPDPVTGEPNQLYYYSDSLGETIKKLNLGTVTHTQNSNTVEIGVINASDDLITQAVINGFKVPSESYKVAVSLTQTFSTLIDNMQIVFNNIKPYDPTDENPDVRTFYVKLFSLDPTNWSVDDYVTIDAEASKAPTSGTSGS